MTFSVTEQSGCKIVTGDFPISAFGSLTQNMSDKAVVDTDLARMMGATLVLGDPENILKLRADTLAVARKRTYIESENLVLSQNAKEWLATGKRGSSSEAMFFHFTGYGSGAKCTPIDPFDFARCRLLLENVPEFIPLLPAMSEVSAQWAALVEHWDEVSNLMDAEVPHWRNEMRSAPRTHDLMWSIALNCTLMEKLKESK